jgi:hypothetical protein
MPTTPTPVAAPAPPTEPAVTPGYAPTTGYAPVSAYAPAPAPAPARKGTNVVLLVLGLVVGVGLVITVLAVLAVTFLGTKTKTATSVSASSATTTTAESTTTTTAFPDSALYVDPNGVYDLPIPSSWTRASTSISGVPMWGVGTGSDGFRDNVNVVVEDLPSALPLDTYVHAASANMAKVAGLSVDSVQDTTLVDGSPAAIVHATNTTSPGGPIHQEAVVAVRGTHAVVVTISAASPEALSAPEFVARHLHLR